MAPAVEITLNLVSQASAEMALVSACTFCFAVSSRAA
jgi:hypothetical protein